MTNFKRKAGFLVAAMFLPVLLPSDFARSQDAAQATDVSLEVMQVLELPVNVVNPILIRNTRGDQLQCQVSNNGGDRILGFSFLVLILDQTNKSQMIASRTEAVKVAAYSTRTVTFQYTKKLKIKSGDRIVLAVEQAISNESIWAVLNSREVLKAYGRGDYLPPEVKQMLNQVDAKPRVSMIY